MALVLNNTLPLMTDANASHQSQYANSYVDVAYADDYWAGHWNTQQAAQWAALSTDQKTGLLIAACRVIETARFTTQVRLRDGYPLYYDRRSQVVAQINDQIMPVKYYYFQRLQFPRNLDRDIVDGHLFIPEPVMNAQCEQAIYLLNFDQTAISNRTQGVTKDMTVVGPIHTRQEFVQDGSMFAPMALEFLRPFFLKSTYQVRRQ